MLARATRTARVPSRGANVSHSILREASASHGGIKSVNITRSSTSLITRSALRFNQRRWGSSGHEYSSDDNGRLFGEKKLAPGQKRRWDTWELPWYLLMYGGILLLALALMLKPDYSLATWAREEAIRRKDKKEQQ